MAQLSPTLFDLVTDEEEHPQEEEPIELEIDPETNEIIPKQ